MRHRFNLLDRRVHLPLHYPSLFLWLKFWSLVLPTHSSAPLRFGPPIPPHLDPCPCPLLLFFAGASPSSPPSVLTPPPCCGCALPCSVARSSVTARVLDPTLPRRSRAHLHGYLPSPAFFPSGLTYSRPPSGPGAPVSPSPGPRSAPAPARVARTFPPSGRGRARGGVGGEAVLPQRLVLSILTLPSPLLPFLVSEWEASSEVRESQGEDAGGPRRLRRGVAAIPLGAQASPPRRRRPGPRGVVDGDTVSALFGPPSRLAPPVHWAYMSHCCPSPSSLTVLHSRGAWTGRHAYAACGRGVPFRNRIEEAGSRGGEGFPAPLRSLSTSRPRRTSPSSAPVGERGAGGISPSWKRL